MGCALPRCSEAWVTTSDGGSSVSETHSTIITISGSRLIRDFMPCGACGQFVLRPRGCKHTSVKKSRGKSIQQDTWAYPPGMSQKDKKRMRSREYARRKRARLTSGN